MLYQDPAKSIDGWLHSLCGAAIYSLLYIQRQQGVSGNSLEIGVYLGKTIAHFICDRETDEITIGVDPFVYDFQPKGLKNANIYNQAIENIKKLNSTQKIKGETILLKGYSTEENIINAVKKYANTFRVVSIDGGHGYKDVMNDLSLASEVSMKEGVLIVDDYCNPICPEVTNAIKDFLSNSPQGKMWKITFVIVPDCSPLSGATRIFLQRKDCNLEYGLLIATTLAEINFPQNDQNISDYAHLIVDLYGSSAHVLMAK
tara:strand:- start:224 stop:1000 length:777 start_codon:yes stop_codon:yes gene_type:complete